jgi:hypothetical protein
MSMKPAVDVLNQVATHPHSIDNVRAKQRNRSAVSVPASVSMALTCEEEQSWQKVLAEASKC